MLGRAYSIAPLLECGEMDVLFLGLRRDFLFGMWLAASVEGWSLWNGNSMVKEKAELRWLRALRDSKRTF